MEQYEAEDRLVYSRSGEARLKRYLDESSGKPTEDIWTDIENVREWSPESLGYQTQKPEQLLERLIDALTNRGDLILDPFCGGGTALVVAERMSRRWVGIDSTFLATSIARRRLTQEFGSSFEFEVVGWPRNVEEAEALAATSQEEFVAWATGLIGATSSAPTTVDRGVDAVIEFGKSREPKQSEIALVSIKVGKAIGQAMVREFALSLGRSKAAIGVLVSLHPVSPPARTAAEAFGTYVSPLTGHSYPRVEVISIEELLAGRTPIFPMTGTSAEPAGGEVDQPANAHVE